MIPMRQTVRPILVFLSLVAVSDAPSAQEQLTCTVVQSECFKRCESEAENRQFCDQYCVDRQRECLSAGVWRGWFGDTFVNVVKE